MSFSDQLQVALKEWDVTRRALEYGRQIILLRKGGIHESSSGFELEHGQFLLFPTYLHQKPAMLKPNEQAELETYSAEPAKVMLSSAGEVTDIIRLKYRKQMDALDGEHIWASPLIDMRFNYRPENPLYLILVRSYRLATPVTIDNTPEHAGCKSWVPLDRPISTSDSQPALEDRAYETRRQRIMQLLKCA